ncbi:MAG: hypothetical protein NT135_02120 [Candidatus Berkelbacteria bacterium]|nr:hypothetical protein [Candidatus Berkelbacteria bacterium]
MTDKKWIKVEFEPAWNCNDNTGKFSLSKGDELEGVFQYKEENVGPNASNLYTFRCGEKSVSVWGSTLLDARFKNLVEGTEVKIIYEGKVKSPKSGRSYHNYTVYHTDAPKEEISVIEEGEAKSFQEQINE